MTLILILNAASSVAAAAGLVAWRRRVASRRGDVRPAYVVGRR